jgi:hypothetical protein
MQTPTVPKNNKPKNKNVMIGKIKSVGLGFLVLSGTVMILILLDQV